MHSVIRRSQPRSSIQPKFGDEVDVEILTGISRRTLQKDRVLGRKRFPWYKFGRRVLYDLAEVEAIIKTNSQGAAYLPSTPAETATPEGR